MGNICPACPRVSTCVCKQCIGRVICVMDGLFIMRTV